MLTLCPRVAQRVFLLLLLLRLLEQEHQCEEAPDCHADNDSEQNQLSKKSGEQNPPLISLSFGFATMRIGDLSPHIPPKPSSSGSGRFAPHSPQNFDGFGLGCPFSQSVAKEAWRIRATWMTLGMVTR